MLLRSATVDDASAIRRIYNHEVEHSTVTFDLVARTESEQIAWIRERSGAHAAIVAEIDGQVAGFGSLSQYRDRAAYSTSVEDSVYVDGAHRGRGVGRALLEELVERARRHGFHAVFARIVGDHAASIDLHRSLGFEVVGREREVGRKFGRWLDVVVMERLFEGNAEFTPPTPEGH